MRNQDTYRNSGLDRAKPKHRFHAFINRNFKRHRTDTTGLVEDSTSSATVVRIIIGLILVHLIVIGGVLLRGHITKGNAGIATAPTITPPPAAPAEPAEILPQPTAPAATAADPTSSNHITQAPPAADEMVAEEESVTIVNPVPAAPAASPVSPAPATVTVKHLVASGDSWIRIAAQYGVTVNALKAANPESAKKNVLYSGIYLDVPVAAGSEAAKQAAATPIPSAPVAKTYTVKRGDTIGKIARMHRMSAAKLLQINEMTDKDARRIRPGMELKVSE